jgi:hypothetical protein
MVIEHRCKERMWKLCIPVWITYFKSSYIFISLGNVTAIIFSFISNENILLCAEERRITTALVKRTYCAYSKEMKVILELR